MSIFNLLASHRPQDECDKELRSLGKTLKATCERHVPGATKCGNLAKNTIEHLSFYKWQDHLTSKVFDENRTPVFWAGFWPGGKKGIDTREALADFVSSVNGFQLADTEWGQVAESIGANNLENCPWDRKKNWWNVASIKMAKAMALHDVQHITIALHKTWRGSFSFYKSVLYQAELVQMGFRIKMQSSWNPEFEVRSIAVKGAPPGESGCALASAIKYQLELKAQRQVTVWCRPCTTPQACGDKELVKKKSLKAKCIKGNCQDGQGTKTWADGEIYEGQWKNNKRDGQGVITHADGSIYDGHWKNNLQDGQGVVTYSNGSIYDGHWKNNLQDGQGVVTYSNGDTYKGHWKEGVKHGQGTFTWAIGREYQGAWKNGLQDGQAPRPGPMAANTKVTGRKASSRAKASPPMPTATSTKVTGKKASKTAGAPSPGPMATSTKVSGGKASRRARAATSPGPMAANTKVHGRRTSSTARAPSPMPTAKSTKFGTRRAI